MDDISELISDINARELQQLDFADIELIGINLGLPSLNLTNITLPGLVSSINSAIQDFRYAVMIAKSQNKRNIITEPKDRARIECDRRRGLLNYRNLTNKTRKRK